MSLLQDKIAILEAELADYKRKEEAQASRDDEDDKKDGYVTEAEFNQGKMKLDDAKMQLQTIDVERKQLQVRGEIAEQCIRLLLMPGCRGNR